MANRTSVDPKCPCLVDQDLPLSKEQLAVKEEKSAMMIDHLVSTNYLYLFGAKVHSKLYKKYLSQI